ncbi:MAG: glycosyltransferase family 2 protein [Verrucomicrobiales bacterium]|nr:glycosyltransferase family 2 protein [Verrucomicrobiales bacterium]
MKISIVIPVFNEAAGIELLIQRLAKVTAQLSSHTWEIVFVDDGSNDDTVDTITKYRHLFHGPLTIVEFSRNFGHQPALLAGLQQSSGDIIFCIDADLQDPPELFGAMLEKQAEGFDVVYAVRKTRTESWPKRWAYKLFYRLQAYLTEIPLPVDAGDFGLVTRRVAEIMIHSADKDLFLRGLRGWSGFRQTGYEYDRPARAVGQAKYSFVKLLRLALSGLFGFSSLPLKFATGIGMISVGGCMIYGIYALIEKLFLGSTPAGWTSTVLLILFLGGTQLLSIGILGEYIGRVYKQLQSRPLFVVKKTTALE